MDTQTGPSGTADDDVMQLSIDDSALSPSYLEALFVQTIPLPQQRPPNEEEDDENVDVSFALSISHGDDDDVKAVEDGSNDVGDGSPQNEVKCDTAAAGVDDHEDDDDNDSDAHDSVKDDVNRVLFNKAQTHKRRSRNQRAEDMMELWAIFCDDSNTELRRRKILGRQYNMTESQVKQKFGNFQKRGMPVCVQKLLGVNRGKSGIKMHQLWLAAQNGKEPAEVASSPSELELATLVMKAARKYIDTHQFPTKGYVCGTA